jgi:hypothetical protein
MKFKLLRAVKIIKIKRLQILDIVERASDWFRICHVCGCAWQPIDYLCEGCWQNRFQIDAKRPLMKSWRDGHIVHALFSWKDSRRFKLGLNDVDSRDVAALARSLKGGRLAHANDRLAAHFWRRTVAFEEISRYRRMPTFLIPAPSEDGLPDHASAWAEALARRTGFAVLSLFHRVSAERHGLGWRNVLKEGLRPAPHQRERTKSERRQVKLGLAAEVIMDLDAVRFIFIDDVVTTGATLNAAYEALGRPKHFECWTIACRAF